MSSDPDASPFNAIPPVVVALALPILLIELVFAAGEAGFVGGPGAVGWRLEALNDYAFSGALLDAMARTGQWPLSEVMRIVTYPFIHLGFVHVIFVLVFLLALGKMVGDIFSGWAVLVIFFGSAIFGALMYTLFLDTRAPLVGAYPAVYGLIGAYTFILWVQLGVTGGPRHQAFTLIAVLMGIQLLFGLLFGGGPQWVAELAGFCGGFLLSFVVSPGGWARVLARLRQR